MRGPGVRTVAGRRLALTVDDDRLLPGPTPARPGDPPVLTVDDDRLLPGPETLPC